MTDKNKSAENRKEARDYLIPVIVLLLLIICGVLFWRIIPAPDIRPETVAVEETMAGGSSIGGPFQLLSHTGETVTEKSWPGQYLLLFFGFTHCPDVCPTELAKMTRILEGLPSATVDKIQPIFISVDPKRDDVEGMAGYVSHFYPSLVGLTGTEEQIQAVVDQYRVYAQAQSPDETGYYVVDHSAFTYLMAPEGELLEVFNYDDPPEAIKKRIQALVE